MPVWAMFFYTHFKIQDPYHNSLGTINNSQIILSVITIIIIIIIMVVISDKMVKFRFILLESKLRPVTLDL